MSARQFRHFVQTTKTTQPRPQVSSTPLITTITVIVSLGVLIFLIATCVKLCCRLKRRILRETLLLQSEDITAEQALDSQLFPLLPPYQPDDYGPPEYEQRRTTLKR